MNCINITRSLQLAFLFRNSLIPKKSYFTLTWCSSNLNFRTKDSLSLIQRGVSTVFTVTDSMGKKDKKSVCTVKSKSENDLRVIDNNFFTLDAKPSLPLISIDRPDRYRNSRTKKADRDKDRSVKRSHSSHSKKTHKKSPTYVSKAKRDYKKERKHKSSHRSLSYSRVNRNKPFSPRKRDSSPPIILLKDKRKTASLVMTKDPPALVANTPDDDDDDIIYEGTFNSSYIPLQSGTSSFFRNHLMKSTTSLSQKRAYTHGKVAKKGRARTSSRNISSLSDHNENNIQRKPNNMSYEDANFVDRVPSSDSDSGDSNIIVENEIIMTKVFTNSAHKEKVTPVSPTTDTSEKNISTNDTPSTSRDLEEGELSEPDSVPEPATFETVLSSPDVEPSQGNTPEHAASPSHEEGEICSSPEEYICNEELEDCYDELGMSLSSDDNVSDCEITLPAQSSNYIPMRDVKLKDLEYYVHVSDETKRRRQELEDLRKWELTTTGQRVFQANKKVDGELFTLLSYNVLAQQLIQSNSNLYTDCEPRILEWSYRWSLLQHEIRHLQPDILTLQEVEGNHFHTHYRPWLEHMGFKCIFKKRTGDKGDGCIIAYNGRKFNLIEETSVEFYQPKGGYVLDRDNIGIIAKLTPAEFHSPFCVATTHILFNPKRADVKLAQVVLLLTELDRICYEGEEGGQPLYCPLILTGDFNCEPHSRIIEVIHKGSLNYTGLSKRTLSKYNTFGPTFANELIPPVLGVSDFCQHKNLEQGRFLEKIRGSLFSLSDRRKIEERLIKISHSNRIREDATSSHGPTLDHENMPSSSSGTIRHSFKFKSVYNYKLNRCNGDREVTTYQDRWVTVDYIFYTRVFTEGKAVEGDLKLLGRYGLLSPAEAMRIGSLPSDICPSDHFPLAAQFLLKPKQTSEPPK